MVQVLKHAVVQGELQAAAAVQPVAEGPAQVGRLLVVNPNTVAKAYHELEREGLVTKRHGSGTYISDNGSPLARRERVKILSQRIDALLAEARHMDVPLKEVIDLVRDRHDNLQPKEGK